MRIGLVTGEFPPMEGGVGAFTEMLARETAAAGHEVHIITSRKARPADAPRTLAATREPIKLDYALLHPRTERWRWPTVATIADIVLRFELDAVNIQYQAAAYNMSSPAINLLPWRLKPVACTVVTFHDLRPPYLFPKAGALRERALRGMARSAHGVIVTNAADEAQVRAWTDQPVARIPIGSNIKVYRPNHVEVAEAHDILGVSGGDVLLGYFGFLNETKGADTLTEALALLDEHFHLVFIGGQTGASDPENNEAFLARLRARIEALGLGGRVHWTGFVDDTRVATFLSAADMIVMPYRDGASTRRGTLMAALAQGRPIVTTRPSQTVDEFVDGHNMVFVPADDPLELAATIGRVAADRALRERLATGASDLATQFAWPEIAARTLAFYEAVCAPG